MSVFLIVCPAHSFGCPIEDLYGPLTATSIPDPMPVVGSQQVLMILVDFSDQPGSYSQQSFRDAYFGNTASTFATYFSEVSSNKLLLSGDVVGVSAGVAVKNTGSTAYVRLPNPKSFYTNGNAGIGFSAFPRNLWGVYFHAIQALEGVGFNFAPYADSQGEVLNVIVVFAGRASTDSRSQNDLRETSVSLDPTFSGGYQSNGYVFKNFTTCRERDADGQAGFGVCAHEYGHGLGIPDLYDTAITFTGVGYFDLMGYGLYGSEDGKRPFHTGAYPKTILGWNQPVLNTGTPEVVTLEPVETGGAIYKLASSDSASEFFLLENRSGAGFDDGFPGKGLCPGLVIWHIDQAGYQSYLQLNKVNTAASSGGPAHISVAVVEQDGRNEMQSAPLRYGECSDSFRTGELWSDSSPGSSKLWDGTPTNFSAEVLSVTDSGALVVALNGVPIPIDGITANVKKKKISGSILKLGEQAGFTISLVKVKGNKTIRSTQTDSVGAFQFKGVAPGKYYVAIDGLSSAELKVKKPKPKK